MTLDAAMCAYRDAHRHHQAATARAQAASARYTAERTADAKEALGDAWRVCDRAMRELFVARDVLCETAVAHSTEYTLFGDAA